jgi:putative ABC transport system substrate-binding protein
MRRRDFIKIAFGSAGAWPLVAGAQVPERKLLIGTLTGLGEGPLARERYAAFLERLQELGWTQERNIRMEYRWGNGNAENIRRQAAELVALKPDVMVVTGFPSTEQVLRATRTIPIVFVIVPDPVGSGLVDSLSRPGHNATGFTQFEYGLSGKWLELLKQIAPTVTRAAVLRDPGISSGIGQFAVIQSVAGSVGIEVIPINMGDLTEVDRALSNFVSLSPHAGMVVTASALTATQRDPLISLAARYKLPAIFPGRDYVLNGGLISYAADFIDQFRRAAEYVDRIFRGEKPADLPVQAPTKYELVINLKTAKSLGLNVPQALLARADEVIE